MSDRELIEKYRGLGWTHLQYASGPSTHPMAAGSRGVESGPRVEDETLVGTPPGEWVDHGNATGSGRSVRIIQ